MQQVGKSSSDVLWSRPFFTLSGGTFARTQAALGSAPSKAEVTPTVSLISAEFQIRISNQLFYLQMRKNTSRTLVDAAQDKDEKEKEADDGSQPCIYKPKKIITLRFSFM